jgi:CRISPR-associated protein Cas8a1/Csx13
MSYDPDGTGMASVTLAYKPCSKYKHQDASKEMISALKGKPVEVVGPLSPGALVRHVAFAAHTKIVEVAERILPLYFALVGCLSLSVNRGVGVLVIPDVHDLESFAALREAMTPTSTKECRITSASDAALQSQVRLHSRWAIAAAGIPACQAVTFKPTPWARQQKSRTAVAHVDSGNDAVLDLFEKALAELPPRIRSKPITEGKGKSKTTRTEYFWVDSRIRPLIADNLAQGNPWYANFATLVSTPEKARSISFEKKGLHAMIEKIAWDNAGAETIVKAVHEAIRQRFGRIADENKGRPVAMKNRWNGERERWRLAFVGAKTADQFRDALADLWSRAGSNPVLRQAWASVLPMLADQRWKLARDLALVGLASYAGKEAAGTDVTETQNEGDQE